MREVNIEAAVASVYSLLNRAERSAGFLGRYDDGGEDDCWHSHDIIVSLHEAYTQLLIVSEALGLSQLNELIRKSYDEAQNHKDGISASSHDPNGDRFLLTGEDVRRFASSLENVYGIKSTGVVSKDVIDILRETQYSITDLKCFSEPPSSEADVHHRIEAVLRCVFPDLDHKPPIPKSVKSFIPDTGLPSIRTLIEYKFIQTKTDVPRVADEILADTRGYKSNEWGQFIFLIYETCRLKREADWNRLLQQCGTALSTHAIVICGETPKQEDTRAPRRRKNTTSRINSRK